MVMADRMNEQHRASKAAQKECMELYLLLLLHSRPHVESGLLVGVQVRMHLSIKNFRDSHCIMSCWRSF